MMDLELAELLLSYATILSAENSLKFKRNHHEHCIEMMAFPSY